jgi:hypothetical protein
MHFLSDSKIIKMKQRIYDFNPIITKLRTTNKRMTNSELNGTSYFKIRMFVILTSTDIVEILVDYYN